MPPSPAAHLTTGLRFILADGSYDREAMQQAAELRVQSAMRGVSQLPPSFQKEFFDWTPEKWLRIAEMEIEAEAGGERAIWEMRAGQTVPLSPEAAADLSPYNTRAA